MVDIKRWFNGLKDRLERRRFERYLLGSVNKKRVYFKREPVTIEDLDLFMGEMLKFKKNTDSALTLIKQTITQSQIDTHSILKVIANRSESIPDFTKTTIPLLVEIRDLLKYPQKSPTYSMELKDLKAVLQNGSGKK